MLLKKRASEKYHSPHQWTNACCSHPRLNESYLEGAIRRTKEELGIDCELTEKFRFIYKADVGNGLWEHELDYVFVGNFSGEFDLNLDEVSEIRYVSIADLQKEITANPEPFTAWFKIIWAEYRSQLN